MDGTTALVGTVTNVCVGSSIDGGESGPVTADGSVDDALAEAAPDGSDAMPSNDAHEASDVGVTTDASGPAEGGAWTCTTSDSCGASVAADAISLNCGYQSAIGNGGYTFSYQDTGGSTACVDVASLCMAGTVLAITDANEATVYGAGIGLQLDKPADGGTANPYPVTASGINYSLSNLPAGAFVCMTIPGYSALLTSTSGTVLWNQFTEQTCIPGHQGAALTVAPTSIPQINFQVASDVSPVTYDFCVTSLSFAP